MLHVLEDIRSGQCHVYKLQLDARCACPQALLCHLEVLAGLESVALVR